MIKTPWFCVCLHWLNDPDPEPYLHDHPATFLSLILRGGYTEVREHKRMDSDRLWRRTVRDRRWWNFIHASEHDRHSIIHVKPRTVTLALMGPKTREWGFHTRDGWVHWKAYNDRKYKGVQS